ERVLGGHGPAPLYPRAELSATGTRRTKAVTRTDDRLAHSLHFTVCIHRRRVRCGRSPPRRMMAILAALSRGTRTRSDHRSGFQRRFDRRRWMLELGCRSHHVMPTPAVITWYWSVRLAVLGIAAPSVRSAVSAPNR